MFNSEIHIWLKNIHKDYATGIDLYERYSDKKWLALFKSGESSFTFHKLVDELEKLKGNENEKPIASGKTAPPDFKRYTAPKQAPIDKAALPPALKELDIKKGELFREASYLHATMCQLPDDSQHDAERKNMAERIIFLFDEIKAIWSRLDHYAATGELPQEKKKPDYAELSELDLHKKRNSIRAMLSRAKRNNNKEKVKEYTKLLNEVEELIK